MTTLQQAIGYTRQPRDLGDNHRQFKDFLLFATGNSKRAKRLHLAFDRQHTPAADETLRQRAAAYIDWVIVTQWGEA